jgi:hypothetical protein
MENRSEFRRPPKASTPRKKSEKPPIRFEVFDEDIADEGIAGEI